MIRQGDKSDIKEIVELYKAGLEEMGYTDWKESLLIKKVIESFILAPCFLLVNDGKVAGMAGLTLVTISHSGVVSLADYMFFIEKDSRNIKNLNALVGEVKEFATKNDFPLRLEFISKDDEKAKERLLRMNGFEIGGVIGVFNHV